MDDTLLCELRQRCRGISLLENEPMAKHTSFRIGGEVSAFALPKTQAELQRLYGAAEELGLPVVLLGNGTNVLFPDTPKRMMVIGMGSMTELRALGDGRIEAQAGVGLARLSSFALELGLTGLEFAHGIPGTVGGGIYMNAGAYDGTLGDVVEDVLVLGTDKNRVKREDCAFAKRASRFQTGGEIILGAEFALQPGSREEIRARMEELDGKRRASQPLQLPSAGSFFKRPEGYFAGKLIQDCGLKGLRVGGAQVSEKHAGFVVNVGGATCADVLELMHRIQNTVFERFGVTLEPEVQIVSADRT